jgi:hypothetical protein
MSEPSRPSRSWSHPSAASNRTKRTHLQGLPRRPDGRVVSRPDPVTTVLRITDALPNGYGTHEAAPPQSPFLHTRVIFLSRLRSSVRWLQRRTHLLTGVGVTLRSWSYLCPLCILRRALAPNDRTRSANRVKATSNAAHAILASRSADMALRCMADTACMQRSTGSVPLGNQIAFFPHVRRTS